MKHNVTVSTVQNQNCRLPTSKREKNLQLDLMNVSCTRMVQLRFPLFSEQHVYDPDLLY